MSDDFRFDDDDFDFDDDDFDFGDDDDFGDVGGDDLAYDDFADDVDLDNDDLFNDYDSGVDEDLTFDPETDGLVTKVVVVVVLYCWLAGCS